MSHWMRMKYVGIGTIANAVQAAIYTNLFEARLLPMATGEYSGPFTNAAEALGTIWLAEIMVLQVGLLLYLVYGPFREQRNRRVVPPR